MSLSRNVWEARTIIEHATTHGRLDMSAAMRRDAKAETFHAGSIAGLAFRAGEIVYDAEQRHAADVRHLRALYEPTASGR